MAHRCFAKRTQYAGPRIFAKRTGLAQFDGVLRNEPNEISFAWSFCQTNWLGVWTDFEKTNPFCLGLNSFVPALGLMMAYREVFQRASSL